MNVLLFTTRCGVCPVSLPAGDGGGWRSCYLVECRTDTEPRPAPAWHSSSHGQARPAYKYRTGLLSTISHINGIISTRIQTSKDFLSFSKLLLFKLTNVQCLWTSLGSINQSQKNLSGLYWNWESQCWWEKRDDYYSAESGECYRGDRADQHWGSWCRASQEMKTYPLSLSHLQWFRNLTRTKTFTSAVWPSLWVVAYSRE